MASFHIIHHDIIIISISYLPNSNPCKENFVFSCFVFPTKLLVHNSKPIITLSNQLAKNHKVQTGQ